MGNVVDRKWYGKAAPACLCMLLCIADPRRAGAQSIVPPSVVTPPSLAPKETPSAQGALSQAPAASAPAGADKIEITVSAVDIDGGYPELAQPSKALADDIRGRKITVAELYRLAAAIEQLYAQAGYILARVTIPPQRLTQNGPVKLEVIDGFIERVDVANVPDRVQSVVVARTRDLIGRRHIRLADLERAVLIAADIPGLKLKSALTPGEQPGGVVLLLQGQQRLASGLLAFNNKLPESMATWQWTASAMLNSAFGLGSQVYAFVGSAFEMAAYGFPKSPLRMIGGGALLPIGASGLTAGAEFTQARTYPLPVKGVPETTGTFQRLALRTSYPLVRERPRSINLSAAIEFIHQEIVAEKFATSLSHDGYAALRLGADWQGELWAGAPYRFHLQGSQGLGGRDTHDAQRSQIPLSHLGASPLFLKANAEGSLSQPLMAGLHFDAYMRTQLARNAQFLSEQFALDGAQGVSPVSDGSFDVDMGVTGRAELVFPSGLPSSSPLDIAPYLFTAGGWGHLYNATAVQQANLKAAAWGGGIRLALVQDNRFNGANVGIELGQVSANVPNVKRNLRLSLIASVPL